mmetsp:Transcript_21216/g.68458  ORF Transcript_21216/g.68458 Transcript_21216/m.68458 type:complete len:112 (-) Transcript_21216:1546-1881(-)
MSSSIGELRTILRHLRRWPSTREAPFWSFVMARARGADSEVVRRASRDYAALLANVSEYNRCVRPSMCMPQAPRRLRALDTGAENLVGSQETVRRAAAKAGLALAEESRAD